MDISRFGEFAILAQSRTFLDAAELLFMSQSTLSKHIMAMEHELGCKLIDRSQRHVTLTAQGEALLPYAQKIATLQHRYLAAIQIGAGEPLEHLTVGSIPIMAPYGITDAVIDFQQANPSYSVELIEGEGDTLKRMLLHEDIDLAFIRDSGAIEPEFKKIPFTTDRLVAVLPLDHPLAECDTVEIDDLIDENFRKRARPFPLSRSWIWPTCYVHRQTSREHHLSCRTRRRRLIPHAQAGGIARQRKGSPGAARARDDLRGQALPQAKRRALAGGRLVHRLPPLPSAPAGRPYVFHRGTTVIIPAAPQPQTCVRKHADNGTKHKYASGGTSPSEAYLVKVRRQTSPPRC